MAEEKIVYQVQDLHKFYDQREILKGITLSFLERAKIGLIGLNGSGKSTLLRIIAGKDPDFEGIAKPVGDCTIGYLEQEPPLAEDKTVGENIDIAVNHLRETEARYLEVMTLMGEAEGAELEKLSAEYDHLQHDMDTKGIWDLDARLKQAANALQVPPMDRDVATLSGGERRRVALCQLLLEHPDMLLLDEPTSTRTRSPGSRATWPSTWAWSSWSPTTATSSTTSSAGCSRSSAARASPTRATTPST